MKYLKNFNENSFEFTPEDLADDIDFKSNTTPNNKHHTLPNEGNEHQELQDDIDIKSNTTPNNKHHKRPNEGDKYQRLQDEDKIKDGISLSKTSEIPTKDVLHKESSILKFNKFK